MKASKVNWLKSDCMLWVCMKIVYLPGEFSFSTIERIVSALIIALFAGLHTEEKLDEFHSEQNIIR
jgi:hypothetical protein